MLATGSLAKMQFAAVITKEETLYVALCPELDVASQGETIEEALGNLKEAIELYLDDEDVDVPERLMTPLLTSVDVKSGEAPRRVRSRDD